jgi:hypothetical protein
MRLVDHETRRELGRIPQPEDSMPGRLVTRWRRLPTRTLSAWSRLKERSLSRWDGVTYRASLIRARLTDRPAGWHRLGDWTAALRLRLADGWSRWSGARRPIVVQGFVGGALAIASVILMVSAWTRDTPQGSIRQPATTALAEPDQDVAAGFDPPTAPPVSDDFLPGVEVHVNEAAGHLFTYPSSWEIDRESGIDRLRHPSGDVVMTFEVAPPGSLQTASDRIVRDIAFRYSNLELDTSPVERTPQGLPSLVVGGHGIGPGGELMRFLVITIQAPDGNRAIAVHFSPDARPLAALPVIREVIASYRISSVREG